jgi:hypothetical protein
MARRIDAERLLLLVALALSATAADASVCGLLGAIPADPNFIAVLAWLAEAAKFVGVAVIVAALRIPAKSPCDGPTDCDFRIQRVWRVRHVEREPR